MNLLVHCVKSVCFLNFSGPKAKKYGSEKLRIRTFFTKCQLANINPICMKSDRNLRENYRQISVLLNILMFLSDA